MHPGPIHWRANGTVDVERESTRQQTRATSQDFGEEGGQAAAGAG